MPFTAQIKLDSQKQSIQLVSHLSILVMLVSCLFWIITLAFSTDTSPIAFISLISIALITYFLNRHGFHRIAAMFGLATFNIAIYSIASSEFRGSGIHIYLGCAAFAALVIFGYEEKRLGLLFFAFSIGLFFMSAFSDYSPLPERQVNALEVQIFFVLNTIAFASICAYLFYLVIRLNHSNEVTLRKSEWRIKQQNEQLVKTNEELDRFVYSASHDLRAPLSSISGIVTLASLSTDVEEIKDYISLIKGRVDVLDKFILDIINYSRNSRIEAVRETINLNGLIHEIIDELKFIPGVEASSFRIYTDPKIEVATDPTRLRMVLNNLVSNAIRYQDITKNEKYIEVLTEKKEDKILIHIKDNGIGIEIEHQEKIFTMFYKASENKSGSGLGLYIAQEAASKLGGTIRVSSVPGEGTTFTIMLPELA